MEQNKQTAEEQQKEMEISSQDPYKYWNLGNEHKEMGKNDEAIKAYDQAIKCKPDVPVFYRDRAQVYMSMKKYKEAIDDFNKCTEIAAYLSKNRDKYRKEYINTKPEKKISYKK